MSDYVRLHRRQPTRLPRPWDPPGKNSGVGCHFLLQCMKVKSESEVAQSCPTLSDQMNRSLPGSSVLGIFQAKEYWSGVPLPSPAVTTDDSQLGYSPDTSYTDKGIPRWGSITSRARRQEGQGAEVTRALEGGISGLQNRL